jgi:hypothetical protein
MPSGKKSKRFTKVYGIDCLLSNTMFIHLKGEIQFKMHTTFFITQHKQSGLDFFWKVDHFSTII